MNRFANASPPPGYGVFDHFVCPNCGDDDCMPAFGNTICTTCVHEDMVRTLDLEKETA